VAKARIECSKMTICSPSEVWWSAECLQNTTLARNLLQPPHLTVMRWGGDETGGDGRGAVRRADFCVCMCVCVRVRREGGIQGGRERERRQVASLAGHCLPGTGGDGGDEVGHPRKVEIRLPGKGNSNSHGARPVYQNHLDDKVDSDQ